MKKRAKGFFWGCMTVVFLAAGLWFLTKLMEPENDYSKNEEFIEDSNKYEVLFFGNSHMLDAVFPLELWHDYGMISYNLAGSGLAIPSTYWVMKNALDISNPRLIVLDCYTVSLDVKDDEDERRKAMLHQQMDYLPLNVNKLRMINDLVEKPEDKLEFAWDFTLYHERWQRLEQEDFERSLNIQKGAKIALDVKPPREMAERPRQTTELESVGVEYLRRTIEECQSREIEILLTYLPFPASEENWQEALCVERIAQEYGVACVNFLDMSVVDLEVDCSDENSHLNGSGGRKVTNYIGQYIKEHYDIADHSGEEAYRDWDEDYGRYTDYKVDTIRELESLNKWLMMLVDPAFDCCLYVNAGSRMLDYEQYVNQVRNLAPGYAFPSLEEAIEQEEDYFLLVDNKNGVIVEYCGEDGGEIETSFGRMVYTEKEDGQKALYIGDSEESLLIDSGENGEELTVQVLAIDNRNSAIVGKAEFGEMFKVNRSVR